MCEKINRFLSSFKKHAHERKLVSFCLSVDVARGMFRIVGLSVRAFKATNKVKSSSSNRHCVLFSENEGKLF